MTLLDQSTGGLAELCGRARPELACLGELAVPLVATLGVVEQVGAGRGVEALTEPTFALDVFAAAGPSADPTVVGRVLDFLRARLTGPSAASGATGVAGSASRRPVDIAEAVERYRAGPFKLMSRRTQSVYNPWYTRLIEAHGRDDAAMVTAGDLKDLIAIHVLATRERGHAGIIAEELAISSFRALWNYLGDKRWATENVAMRLKKPTRRETTRRGWRPEEAVLARHLARGYGHSDPLLNEVTMCLSERMCLRREEYLKLRMCDVNWERAVAKVHGKGGKVRDVPIPPVFFSLLREYVEQRRPASIAPEAWMRSTERLLRHRPSPGFPMGRHIGSERVTRLMRFLRKAAPDLIPSGELCLHTHRNAVAN